MFAFNYQHLKSVTFPSFVKEIEERRLHGQARKGDLTSVAFETSPDGSGIECLYGSAFTDCDRAFLAGA